MPHSSAVEPLRQWLAATFGKTATSIEATEPGLSGAVVFRVDCTNGEVFALKRFPDGTSPERIAAIHRFMTVVRENGCDWVPRVCPLLGSKQTAAVTNNPPYGWELVTWVKGSSFDLDAAVASSPGNKRLRLGATATEAVAKGAAAIACIHRSARPLGMRRQPAASVRVRLKRIDEISSQLNRLRSEGRANVLTGKLDFLLGKTVLLAIERLSERWETVSKSLKASLCPLASCDYPNQYVLRDVHREHILFESTLCGSVLPEQGEPFRVSGMIDFDAIRIDSVATDLCRWTTSFITRSVAIPELWDAAFAGYRLEWELSDSEQWLARSLASASAWISLANWVGWVALEGRKFPVTSDRIAARIDACLDLVDLLD